MNWQRSIREYELFVSGGVREIPASVYENDLRAAGEYRVTRSPRDELVVRYPGIVIGRATIDLSTGELIEE